MAQYKGTVTAPHAPDEVWRYLADLRSIAEWDPASTTHGSSPASPARSARATRSMSASSGERSRSPTRPSRPIRRTESSSRPRPTLVSVRDEADIGLIVDGGSRVTWNADLRLDGPQRILDLPLRAAFNRIGERAERGLAERLAEPILSRSSAGARA